MAAIAAMLTQLPDAWKAWLALAGASAIGAAATMFYIGHEVQGMSAEHTQLVGIVSDNSAWRAEHSAEFERLVCVIALPDSVAADSNARTRECGI